MLDSARLTLKQHRFEVVAGAIGAIVLGTAALWVNWKLANIDVPPGCFDAWLSSAGVVDATCEAAVRAFAAVDGEEAAKLLAAMAVLPLAVGLLGGVALVGRELESRTAQTAWALAASRRRWLARQLWPVVLVLGVTIVFAALAASVLVATREAFSTYPLRDFGLHGPAVVARGLAAFGVGLVAGAVLGRTLPAFIVGAVVSIGMLFAAIALRGSWVSIQPRVVLDADATGSGRSDTMTVEQAWRAPDGSLLGYADASSLAAAEGHLDPYEWLTDQGYQMVELGITGDSARRWEPIEIAGFTLVGVGLIAATVVVVDRRRPA